MRKAIEFFKLHKKIITVAVLLIIFIILGVVLFGSSAKLGTSTSTTNSAVRSEAESKLTRILSEIEGVGEAEVYINENGGKVEGVVVVCEGANNIMTKNDVLNAVMTALNVEKYNVAIYAMNK